MDILKLQKFAWQIIVAQKITVYFPFCVLLCNRISKVHRALLLTYVQFFAPNAPAAPCFNQRSFALLLIKHDISLHSLPFQSNLSISSIPIAPVRSFCFFSSTIVSASFMFYAFVPASVFFLFTSSSCNLLSEPPVFSHAYCTKYWVSATGRSLG